MHSPGNCGSRKVAHRNSGGRLSLRRCLVRTECRQRPRDLPSGSGSRRSCSSVGRLQSIAEEGKQRGEIHSAIDSVELAMLIVSSLEGGLMVSRLQRKDDALDSACRHLEKYLETTTRTHKSKIRPEES